jgi:hypothetical protein
MGDGGAVLAQGRGERGVRSIGSLASLLLAADIAGAQRGRLHVAHVSPPPVWTGMAGPAGMTVPASSLAEADHAAASQLQDRVGDVLALGASVEWTFTWTRGMVHQTVSRLVSELSPVAVVPGRLLAVSAMTSAYYRLRCPDENE